MSHVLSREALRWLLGLAAIAIIWTSHGRTSRMLPLPYDYRSAGFFSSWFGKPPEEAPVGEGARWSEEAKALRERLVEQVGKGVLFGHQDTSLYGVGWSYNEDRSDVKDVCGRWPSVYGWDIGAINADPDNIDYVPTDILRTRIMEADHRGGINTISFHQNNPQSGQRVFSGGQLGKPTFPLTEETTENLRVELDKFSDFLLSLRREDGSYVPIICRPYHEHNKDWSWWGIASCSDDEFKELWRFSIEYIRSARGVNHVLFCYAPQDVTTVDEYMAGYPGDDYVDVFGLDFYMVWDKQQMELLATALQMITDLAEEHGKVAALTETGIQNIPISNWWSQYLLPVLRRKGCSRIVWALVWRNNDKHNFFAPYPGQESADDFVLMSESGAVEFGPAEWYQRNMTVVTTRAVGTNYTNMIGFSVPTRDSIKHFVQWKNRNWIFFVFTVTRGSQSFHWSDAYRNGTVEVDLSVMILISASVEILASISI